MEQFLRLGVILPPFLFIAGSWLIAKKWHIGRHASLCAHGTQTRQTSVLFGIMTSLLALWHYAGWLLFLHPRLDIPYFYALFVLATICILIISFVPIRESRPRASMIHSIAGALQACVLVVLSALIVANNQINLVSYWGLIAFAACVPVLGMLCLVTPKIRNQMFVLEAAGIALFSLSIALIAIEL